MIRSVLAAILAAPLTACGGWEAAKQDRPSIVLIVVDTLRRDHVSVYGGKVPTPNLEALAARGRVYHHAYSSFHQTTMSMGALFTGRTPSLVSDSALGRLAWNGRTWCGMARFAADDEEEGCIPRGVPTLAERLRDAGYWTAGLATNELTFAPSGLQRGFDHWREMLDPTLGRTPRGTVRPAAGRQVNAAGLEALSLRPRDVPFFLYLHYMEVHDYQIWGASYPRMVRRTDAILGELFAALEERGLLDDTVIVFTSDHGERRGGRNHFTPGRPVHFGNPSFEEVLEVPLIVAPAVLPPSDALLRSTDTHRMILELAGVEPVAEPELADGELWLSERHYTTYRRGRWKSYRSSEAAHLVDLEADPDETTDVSGSHPEVVREHRERVDRLAERFAAGERDFGGLSDEDRRRLGTLGYLEVEESE